MEPLPELTPAQTTVFDWLDRHGAVSPSQILAQVEMPPGELWATLEGLGTLGLLVIRDDPDSVDGKLVVPIPRYSNIAQQNAPITKMMRGPDRPARG